MPNFMYSNDSSPKWLTQVDLDGQERTTEATLYVLPQIEYSDAPFTRVQFNEADPCVTPLSMPA